MPPLKAHLRIQGATYGLSAQPVLRLTHPNPKSKALENLNILFNRYLNQPNGCIEFLHLKNRDLKYLLEVLFALANCPQQLGLLS